MSDPRSFHFVLFKPSYYTQFELNDIELLHFPSYFWNLSHINQQQISSKENLKLSPKKALQIAYGKEITVFNYPLMGLQTLVLLASKPFYLFAHILTFALLLKYPFLYCPYAYCLHSYVDVHRIVTM